jgi:hypothetical protein
MSVLGLLTSPSGYEKKPKKYAVNQLLHFTLCGLLPVVLWGSFGVALVVVFFLAWEFIQLRYFGANFWDCIEDLGFVFAGTISWFSGPLSVVPVAFLYVSGISRRLLDASSTT